MCAQTTIQSLSSEALRSKALKDGCKDAVKVNQRMLIDKMLTRYSSDFVVCRELVQNADDATASSFSFEILCTPDASHQINFHNSIITEIRAVNNGLIFTEVDWKRVASIAEGNTNVESVGQFGVGFFSVFSFSEEPIIVSGKECMTFVWQEDDSLSTFRLKLPVEQQSNLTSIILKMRGRYVLDTETLLTEKDTQLSTKSITSDNETRTSKTEIIPTINLSQLKAYFTKGK
jgi:HSP90 family molecular chaperone